MRTPLTRHLTHEQLCDLILALPEEAESSALEPAHDHLRNCLICSAEFEALRDSLALFRQAASSYAGHAYSRPAMNRASIAPSPRFRSHVLYWAMAAVLAIAVALPFSLRRQHTPAPQPAAAATVSQHATESDEALLDGIAQDLSADVPAAMHPLADPTADPTASQSAAEQRKN